MVKVKICGITNLEDALLSERLGADALGFIFTEKSPRYIDPLLAKKVISSLGPFIFKIGVFMDQKKEKVLKIASFLKLDALQFHGRESFTYSKFFKPKFKVIKVFFPDSPPGNSAQYKNLDALMFDISYEQKKKGQKTLPAGSLFLAKEKIKEGKKTIISGGLNCENVKKALKLNPYGIDVASGIEKCVGKKDKKLLKKFIERAKNVYS